VLTTNDHVHCYRVQARVIPQCLEHLSHRAAATAFPLPLLRLCYACVLILPFTPAPVILSAEQAIRHGRARCARACAALHTFHLVDCNCQLLNVLRNQRVAQRTWLAGTGTGGCFWRCRRALASRWGFLAGRCSTASSRCGSPSLPSQRPRASTKRCRSSWGSVKRGVRGRGLGEHRPQREKWPHLALG
jgi:hypothetical protein